MTHVGAIAAWTGPVLLVATVARVTDGGPEAPLFVLTVLVAPLLALLAEPAPGAPSSPLALPVALVAMACVLGASVRAVTDLGRVAGVSALATLGWVATLALVPIVSAARDRISAVALGVGVGALLAAVVGLGHVVDAFPWTAWSRVASRSAFELGAGSEWTRDGFRPLAPVSLTPSEPQRVTVVSAAVYRVTERDRAQPIVREWRLAAGAVLLLRPGDTLTIPPDGRVRFETGARVPAGAASGAAWADGSPAGRGRAVTTWIGLTVTLVGGAMALVRPLRPLSRGATLLGPVAALGVALGAAAWAVYTVDIAPELSIGMPPGASLAGLAAVVPEPWASRLLVAAGVATLALLLASAAALHQRLVDLALLQRPGPSGFLGRRVVHAIAWGVVVAAAVAAGTWIVDSWALLRMGTGLAAAAILGPLVATADAREARRARLAGALIGIAVFVVTPHAMEWVGPLPADAATTIARYPALLAVPAAWLVALVVRSADAARGEMVAALRRH